jgi:hypothetical protein
MNFSEQIKHNSLAIISLFLAFSALGYNTWRNELTEENRNIRMSGFEMIMHIGELQKISYLAHFDGDRHNGNPRIGWTEVLLIRDLSGLMPREIQNKADDLVKAWENNWMELGKKNEFSIAKIDTALHDLRVAVLHSMKKLD